MSALCLQEFIVPIHKFLVYARFSSTIAGMKKTSSSVGLKKAIAEYPTLRAFADALGVPYQNVQQWLRNGVPADYAPEIEKLVHGKVRCEELNSRVDWAYLRSTGGGSVSADGDA
jgi:DNA-binding transcriptional regulator YdaS (Cro superfamily)